MAGKNKNKFALGVMVGFVVSFLALGAAVFFVPETVLAQATAGNYGPTFGLGTADLLSTVIKVVQWALGFLGLVAVIVILYGGFIWMTAGGSPEKVAKAKKIIIRAVIGLIIVLLAWAIVTFVYKIINDATGGPGDGCVIDTTTACSRCEDDGTGNGIWVVHPEWPGCSPEDTFRIKYRYPKPNQTGVPLCAAVQVQFNGSFVYTSINGNAALIDNVTNLEVPGIWQAGGMNQDDPFGHCHDFVMNGDETDVDCGPVAGECEACVDMNYEILEFVPASDYESIHWYRVELTGGPGGITEDAALPRPYNGDIWWFETGDTTLDVPPNVVNIFPSDGETDICLNTAIQSLFSSDMRIASINTNTVEFANVLTGPHPLKSPFGYSGNFRAFSTRPATVLDAGAEYNVTLIAGVPGDTSPNNGIMDVCFNHLDGDEDGLDEGSAGSDDFLAVGPPANSNPTFPNEPWNFFADTDTTNVDCYPEITDIIPPFGKYVDPAPGVKIVGSNFGIFGDVVFNKGVLDFGNCFTPVGVPNLNCVVSWLGGAIDTRIPGGPPAFYRDIPSAGAKDGGVRVEMGPNPEDISNKWDFDVTSPQIKKASGLNNQPHGGEDQYVSLIKRSDDNAGFGDAVGMAQFRKLSDPPPPIGSSVLASFPPDPPCDITWTDDYVIIKVPDLSQAPPVGLGINPCQVTAANPWYDCPMTAPDSVVGIQLRKQVGFEPSNIIKFIYTDEEAGPGLCSIDQVCGESNDPRILGGENFQAYDAGSSEVLFQMDFDLPYSATIINWLDQTIDILVPDLDNDKGYDVTVTNAIATSNALPFDVPCGDIPRVLEDSTCYHCDIGAANAGDKCTEDLDCPGGACMLDFSSPNPNKNAQDVCVNSIMAAVFSLPMTNLNGGPAGTVILDECTDGEPCTATNWVAGGVTTFASPFNDRFIFTPNVDLNPSTYYQMTISKEVRSFLEGVKMNNDYVWKFKTKDNATPCPVEKILVTPSFSILYNEGDAEIYTAIPVGPECTMLNPGDYPWTWTSDDPSMAAVTGSPTNLETATIQVGAVAGTTYINAETEAKLGRGKLKYDPESCKFDPDRCHDPNGDGIDECLDSECDIIADRCMPVIFDQTGDLIDFTPASGPPGTMVSVEGCWFGNSQGDVRFGFAPGDFFCANPWSDNLIVVTSPDTLTPGNNYLIDVLPTSGRCAGGGADDGELCANAATCDGGSCSRFSTATDSGQTGAAYEFSCTDTCTSICDAASDNPYEYCNVPADCPSGACVAALPPDTGVPGICPPLHPSAAKIGDGVRVDGYYLLDPGDTSDTRVHFPVGLQDTYNDVIARGEIWNPDVVDRSKVPVDAVSGQVDVQVNNCPSNQLPFGIACDSAGDCGTNCCKYDDLIGRKICKPFIPFCAVGPGQPCQIKEIVTAPDQIPENPECDTGQIWKADDYMCISDTGDTSPEPPPLPLFDDDPVPYGTDCRVCCDALPIPQTSDSGLLCYANKGTCTGVERGRYCGCTLDIECGPQPGPVGCGFDDPDQCCWQRPEVDTTNPDLFENIFCTNQVIRYTFETYGLKMDRDSMNTTNIIVTDGVNPIPGKITTNDYGFAFTADSLYTLGQQVDITVTTNVTNQYGVGLEVDHFRSWTVDATATICKINNIDFEVITGTPEIYDPPDTFMCALDDCSDDSNAMAGNQHDFLAWAVDKFDNIIAATYDWTEEDSKNVITLEEADNDTDNIVTARPSVGRANVKVEATADNFIGPGSQKTGKAKVNVLLCERPWPNPYAPDNDDFPFEDSSANPKPDTITGANIFTANFSIWYCRDPGDLPILNPTNQIIVREGSTTEPDLEKEYFFLRQGSPDGIGIRIMKNGATPEQSMSPREWYYNEFGPAAPVPQDIEVDGYAAVRAGRTVYVSVPNLDDVAGVMTPYIYLLSYNEGATEETINVYNRMLQNWEFNVNDIITTADKDMIRRDMQRINDLSDIYAKALIYKEKNGHFPKLDGGTFIASMTTSKWPSWQGSFAEQLVPMAAKYKDSSWAKALRDLLVPTVLAAGNLPVDPLNEMYLCPLAYRSDKEYQHSGVWPSGITRDGKGNVYHLDYGPAPNNALPKSIYRCNDDLTSCDAIYDQYNTANDRPLSISIDKSNGDVLVVVANILANENHIDRFDPDDFSAPKKVYDQTHGLGEAMFVATDSSGLMYVTIGVGVGGIHQFNPADNTLTGLTADVGPCGVGNPCPYGIDIDGQGNVYATLADQGAVRKYDSNLNVIQTMAGFVAPHDINVTNDSVFVTDSLASTVTELSKDLLTVKNRIYNPDLNNPYSISAFSGGFYIANLNHKSVNKYIYDADGANTCWNAIAGTYDCPASSHIYQYMSYGSGDWAYLYANLEYIGLGSWANGPPWPGPINEACQDITNATCDCFNYQYNVTGTPADHEGPIINSVDLLVPVPGGPNAVSGTRNLPVDVIDADSGVNRVEFFVDGIKKFTDDDGTAGGWTWDLDSTEYADGDHKLTVTAYDNVGNFTAVDFNINVNNASGPDNINPFVAITYPADGDTVSGTITITAEGSDNQVAALLKVEALTVPVLFNDCLGATNTLNCSLVWDTTLYTNGEYEIQAQIIDAVGQWYAPKIKVTVDNPDANDPVVTINDPGWGAFINGIYTVWVTATDNQQVEEVKFYIDGVAKGNGVFDIASGDWSWDWDTTVYSDEVHTLAVYAYDPDGNYGTDSVIVTMNNGQTDIEPPEISFIRPPTPVYGDAIFNNFVLQVEASDNVGVIEVNYYWDYILRSTDYNGADDWIGMVDISTLSDGWHTFQVDAVDAAGNRSETLEIYLNIRGGGGPICGDGLITKWAGEVCEGFDLDEESCMTLGYDCGSLACYPPGTPSECLFDTSSCMDAVCGNGTMECNEVCELPNINCAPLNTCQTAACIDNCLTCDRVTDCTLPGCVSGSPDWCANCNHCTDGVQNCDETGVDCGGAACPSCDCTGEMRCSANWTQNCVGLNWFNDPQGPIYASGGFYYWKGQCFVLGSNGAVGSCTSNSCTFLAPAGLPIAGGPACRSNGAGCCALEGFDTDNSGIPCCPGLDKCADNVCRLTCSCDFAAGEQRCIKVDATTWHTELCVDDGTGTGVWQMELQTLPADCSANGVWDGDCSLGVGAGSCFLSQSCDDTNPFDAKCVSGNPLQCNAQCQADWFDAYNACCNCVDGDGACPAGCNWCNDDDCAVATCAAGCCDGDSYITPPNNVDCGLNCAACVNCTLAGEMCNVATGICVSCADGDGVCPAGCNWCNDDDCAVATCAAGCCDGDSYITPPNNVDCGLNCAACTDCTAAGEMCNVATGICVSCADGDGVCPAGCNWCNDDDCAASTCTGNNCCNFGAGACNAISDVNCGLNGNACVDCTAAGQVCNVATGTCEDSCGPGNCPGGCCAGNTCVTPTTDVQCGLNGNACVDCTATDQICNAGVCEDKPYSYMIVNYHQGEVKEATQLDPRVWREPNPDIPGDFGGLSEIVPPGDLIINDPPWIEIKHDYNGLTKETDWAYETVYIYTLPTKGVIQYYINLKQGANQWPDQYPPPFGAKDYDIIVYNSANIPLHDITFPLGCRHLGINAVNPANSYEYWYALSISAASGVSVCNQDIVTEGDHGLIISGDLFPVNSSNLLSCPYGLPQSKCCELDPLFVPDEYRASCSSRLCGSGGGAFNECKVGDSGCEGADCYGDFMSGADCCSGAPFCVGDIDGDGTPECRAYCGAAGEVCTDYFGDPHHLSCCSFVCGDGLGGVTCQ